MWQLEGRREGGEGVAWFDCFALLFSTEEGWVGVTINESASAVPRFP